MGVRRLAQDARVGADVVDADDASASPAKKAKAFAGGLGDVGGSG